MPKYRAISERCLMDHDLQKTVSYDMANCIACGAPLLRGTDMFECTSCTDMWTYCVDCKRAWDLRPSHSQRQQNAQARACGKALYKTAPTRQPSERHMLAVGEEQGEQEQEEKVHEKEQQGKLEAASPANLATLDGDESLVKELLELFNVSGAASSS